MAIFYQKNVNKSLKICEVQENSLKKYITGKKEKKKIVHIQKWMKNT